MRIQYFLLLFILLLIQSSIIPQENNSDHFLLGSYLNASSDKLITYHRNFWQVREMGMNTVLQRNIVEVSSIDQESNFDSLMQFSTIIAINDSANYSGVSPDNIDWIYYFTNALYSKWEAEGSPYFSGSEPVGVKHNGIGHSTVGGWSSGTEGSEIGKYFILGPNYTQYMRYVYSNKFNNENPIIQYTANFCLKLGEMPLFNVDVAEIEVTLLNVETGGEAILNSKVLKASDLSHSYQVKPLTYNYSNYSDAYQGDNGNPAGPAWYAPQSMPESNFFDARYKIQFKVKRLSNTEIFVDYVEVYDAGDNGIWDFYFNNSLHYTWMIDSIISYNQQFDALGTKQKYYHTIDEPHSIDCFAPIQRVQQILDSQQIEKDLLVHFYPGWNNYRDSVNIMQKWVDIAQPKKLLFWYFPYWVDASDEFGKLPLITDSLVLKVVTQLSDLCLVGNQQYLPAINSFDEIAQQNPETEEGLFAEIDALTTAIISYNEGGGGLQKELPGKYAANSQGELVDRLNNLMNTNFEGESKKVNIIPTEYSLYNNYPNPFNPTTIIRFDIPESTNVELIVYNILGRRVKSLVNNELRNPGSYEVSFDAGSLASGVYIYKLTTQILFSST